MNHDRHGYKNSARRDFFREEHPDMKPHKILYHALTQMNGSPEAPLRRRDTHPTIHLFSVFIEFWDTERTIRDMPLDFGWCELEANSLKRKDFVRVTGRTNLSLSNSDHLHPAEAVSEVLPNPEAISKRLRTLLDGMPSEQRDINVILVWNWERTKDALARTKYEHLGNWKKGLPQELSRVRSSGRSASPSSRHRTSVKHESSSNQLIASGSRHRSPLSSSTPFYVIDLVDFQRLCLKIQGFDAEYAYHRQLMMVTKVGTEHGHGLTSRTGCCAADDCHILLDMWQRLASGSLLPVSRHKKKSRLIGLKYEWQAPSAPNVVQIRAGEYGPNPAPQQQQHISTATTEDSEEDSDEDNRALHMETGAVEQESSTGQVNRLRDPQELEDDSECESVD